MAKMTNEQKLEAVKNWLTENNIEFTENYVTKTKLRIDLWLPKLYIAIHLDDDYSERFYKKTFRWCKPFFIRDSETKAFVMEKIQNCCYDQMLRMQKIFERKQNKEN